jgi:hypothetical protein
MSFNLQKYLIENNLTLTGRIRLFEEEEETEKEPSKEDMKSTEKDMRELDKNKAKLKDLQAKVKDIIFKFTKDTPTGKVLTDVTAYKKAIKDLPQQIKDLKKKIEAVENPSAEQKEEE